jgi:hypothetical protein
MSFQTPLDNHTPFAADKLVTAGPDGQEWTIVLLCASFERGAGGALEVAAEQTPIRFADEYFGDPASSSVRYAADIGFDKPFVDVVLNATAHAPSERAVRRINVELEVNDIRKRLVVIGDRLRRSGPFGTAAPEPFVSMPIVYERSFGGTGPGGDKIELRPPHLGRLARFRSVI